MPFSRIVSSLVLLALLAACQPPPPREALDREALRQQLHSLAAIAAEAGLLVQQLSGDKLAGSFAWVEQQGLGEDAARAAAEVARPVDEGLRDAQRDALQVAGALQLELTRVAAARHDAGALQALELRFSQLKARAQHLERAA